MSVPILNRVLGETAEKVPENQSPMDFEPEPQDTMKFDGSDQNLHDLVLVVDGREFFVSRKMLALHSSSFYSMFSGNFAESSMEKVDLPGVASAEFQLFLETIHGKKDCLNDENVHIVMKLADMWDAQFARRKCHEFLMKKSKISKSQILQMAAMYNDQELEKLVFDTANDPIELKEFRKKYSMKKGFYLQYKFR